MAGHKQDPIGHGIIVWVGVNLEPRGFSTKRNYVNVTPDGIEDDMYRDFLRKTKGHDVDYCATDGITTGRWVLNHRQITIVESSEIIKARQVLDLEIGYEMTRANFGVTYVPINEGAGMGFSYIQPFSRMVIEPDLPSGEPVVLHLTEENGPCRGIAIPMAQHFGGDAAMASRITDALIHRRGQMAMVKSPGIVRPGTPFKVFPPMDQSHRKPRNL